MLFFLPLHGRCERRLEAMSIIVEQERWEKENREEMHKNELRLVEELLNGRQPFTVFMFFSLRVAW